MVTDCDRYKKDRYAPKICPNGREYYAGMCYKPCPPGYTRTAAYTCSRGAPDYNPALYNNDRYLPTNCPVGKEYYGSTCVSSCPSGYERTAACSCKFGDIYTDCGAFGPRQGMVCGEGKVESGGLCYNACPYNGKRTAICTCYYTDDAPKLREPDKNCNNALYPLPSTTRDTCWRKSGHVDSYDLDGGGSVPLMTTCNDPSRPVPSSDGNCYQNWCPNGGQRGGRWSCFYPGGVQYHRS